ncbi:nuclear autoantigenic sperm protein isoform X1 [Octopus sinensis]|uniref:Nuclear autoantigenic sperm protein isoform X1 n=1 Tax=Octopus sinensis TaxID=2607531 RepID=A0A6P7TJB9_9MOLL|nr:nuclear autoantigenic sperm protein isoform X1 [Octopus sinensis]
MSSVAEPSSSAASGSPSKERVEVMSKAVNLMGQGKRNLICGDVPMAVTQFEESCQILAKCYGEMAFECAAAYFSYGHALLELARLDSKVIESLEAEAAAAEEEEDDDDDDEEEGDDGENEKSEKDSEKDDGASSKAASKEDEGTGDEDRTDNSESLSSQDEAVENQEKPEEKDPDEDEHDAGNDVTNLQLAWESLELAKIIYLKRKDKESQLKAAQAYLKLGEVGLETGLYDLAVEDIKECLKIQKEHLNPEEREIAETYYQLGLVHVFASNHDSAVENFKAAISVIEAKIDKLNKSIEHLKDSTETADVETVYNARTEIKELEEIVPDITQKITDTIEEKKTVADLKAFAKKEAAEKMMSSSLMGAGSSSGFAGPSSSSSSGGSSGGAGGDVLGSTTGFSSILPVDPKSSSQPVKTTDISHLVRRKRKPETEESSEDKKQKTESSVDNTSSSSSSKAEQKDSNSDLAPSNKEPATEESKKPGATSTSSTA